LIITQKVDRYDPVLGFFHRWIEEFSKYCDQVVVICLEAGDYLLPEHVKVLSLGKEDGVSKVQYVARFCRYIWRERKNYDTVFVHMNQEYVLLGWWLWKIFNKRIMMWRNHAVGSWLTRLAVLFSDQVFCTSPHSFTARYKKTQIMPVGIDTEFFKPDQTVTRKPNSFLFLGRIAPVKKVLEFIDWLHTQDFALATIAGSVLPLDNWYQRAVLERIAQYNLNSKVQLIGGVTQEEAMRLYQSHETYVNFTPSGSMDKTIFEAAACEMSVMVKNNDLSILEGKSGKELRNFVVVNHSLEQLISKLHHVISQ
jgi:glycosyltransferase involved in cell wall biosynthesis